MDEPHWKSVWNETITAQSLKKNTRWCTEYVLIDSSSNVFHVNFEHSHQINVLLVLKMLLSVKLQLFTLIEVQLNLRLIFKSV